MTQTKIGRPRIRLVTTLSIFSEVVSFFGALTTQAAMVSEIQS